MRAFSLLLILAVATGEIEAQLVACDREGWRAVLAAHAARYPLMTFEDTYKILHQGVFGSEHAAPDEASARAYLSEELNALTGNAGARDGMVESIAPGNAVVRVHLRPYIAAGLDPEAVLAAFLATAGMVRGSVEEFRCAADVAPDLDPVRWPAAAWGSFVDVQVSRGLPALHHSAAFTAAYAPAYRVVSGSLVGQLGAQVR